MASPTFPLVIEMRQRSLWVTHWVENSVDLLLQGRTPRIQVMSAAAVVALAFRCNGGCKQAHLQPRSVPGLSACK